MSFGAVRFDVGRKAWRKYYFCVAFCLCKNYEFILNDQFFLPKMCKNKYIVKGPQD